MKHKLSIMNMLLYPKSKKLIFATIFTIIFSLISSLTSSLPISNINNEFFVYTYASEANNFNGYYISANGDTLPVYAFHKSGNDNENFNILFLGDGYTNDQQEMFLTDISKRVTAIFSTEPYKSMSDKINIYAVPTVSNESGASYVDIYSDTDDSIVKKDTYFSITQSGKSGIIREVGKNKAKAIKSALENTYLDSDASINTIHIVSNSSEYFGAVETSNSLFSCSSRYNGNSSEMITLHEISHSIGGLADEYATTTNPGIEAENASASGKSDIIKWKNFLGFRGIGIHLSQYGGKIYIPSDKCIMKDLYDKDFCEVCKAELIRGMSFSVGKNSTTQDSGKTPFKEHYIANPDITIEHDLANTTGTSYKSYQITENNITNANDRNLEFRTVVQNLENKEKNFRLLFKITDKYNNIKHSVQQDFNIPALSNIYDPKPSQKSLSVTIEKPTDLQQGDLITAQVIDIDTNKILATNKTQNTVIYKLNINHRIKDKNGNTYDMPNSKTTTLRVPKDSVYTLPVFKQLNGYTYVGNSSNSASVTVSDFNTTIDFYYQEPIKKSINISLSADNKTVFVTPQNILDNISVILAFYDNNELNSKESDLYDITLKEVKIINYNPETDNDITYTPTTEFSAVKVFTWNSLNDLTPIFKPQIITIEN